MKPSDAWEFDEFSVPQFGNENPEYSVPIPNFGSLNSMAINGELLAKREIFKNEIGLFLGWSENDQKQPQNLF